MLVRRSASCITNHMYAFLRGVPPIHTISDPAIRGIDRSNLHQLGEASLHRVTLLCDLRGILLTMRAQALSSDI
jgi:hypothetical protein